MGGLIYGTYSAGGALAVIGLCTSFDRDSRNHLGKAPY
jgi:hypothetical protein